ncbi:M24 family metallopeptidase, partial [Cytophagia bacterium CHB2]|nr:M24 family metallopeptidase [Cytophagia bacterium CHB2]
ALMPFLTSVFATACTGRSGPTEITHDPITSRAFEHIAPLIKPGCNENEIAQEILNMFRENGATGLAFPLIVGSGANATRPHYSANNAVMNKGLVVIDIGCSVENYASDMTRTFAVNGRLSAAERELMDIVIAAGDSARAHLKPGATMRDLHERAARVIAAAGFGPYFTHMLGHHVGLEVHDPQINTLAAGMVITIEPGIYIPAGAAVDSVYWNLGVRIEDTYIVTENGFEQITHFPHIWPARGDSLPARFDP